ncbi:MAG: hypothetical protein ACRDQ7_08030 [Haloechinothrix sp.]
MKTGVRVRRDLVVQLPDGSRRHVFASQPVPADLLDLVPVKDRVPGKKSPPAEEVA